MDTATRDHSAQGESLHPANGAGLEDHAAPRFKAQGAPAVSYPARPRGQTATGPGPQMHTWVSRGD
eukprot:887373-Alexandrium_andersonii.AAC.1